MAVGSKERECLFLFFSKTVRETRFRVRRANVSSPTFYQPVKSEVVYSWEIPASNRNMTANTRDELKEKLVNNYFSVQ